MKKTFEQLQKSEREKESRFGLWIYKAEHEALEIIKLRFENAESPAVNALFNKFDESIQAAQERAEKRKIMSFEELAEDMGY